MRNSLGLILAVSVALTPLAQAADVKVEVAAGEVQEQIPALLRGMNLELHQKDWAKIITPDGDLM